jgi:hypothetical protein
MALSNEKILEQIAEEVFSSSTLFNSSMILEIVIKFQNQTRGSITKSDVANLVDIVKNYWFKGQEPLCYSIKAYHWWNNINPKYFGKFSWIVSPPVDGLFIME